MDNAAAVSAAIGRMRGVPIGASFGPSPPQPAPGSAAAAAPLLPYSLVLFSPGSLLHFDLSRPVEAAAAGGARAAEGAATAGRPQRRVRRRPDAEADAARERLRGRGANGRLLHTEHPAVWLGHVGGGEALLLLERPWESVLEELPPPLLLHRYGS